jgi:hypothetical protein
VKVKESEKIQQRLADVAVQIHTLNETLADLERQPAEQLKPQDIDLSDREAVAEYLTGSWIDPAAEINQARARARKLLEKLQIEQSQISRELKVARRKEAGQAANAFLLRPENIKKLQAAVEVLTAYRAQCVDGYQAAFGAARAINDLQDGIKLAE